jgi:hypothetical protein
MANAYHTKPTGRNLFITICLVFFSSVFAKPVAVEQVKKAADTLLKAESMRAEKQLKTLAIKEIQKESLKKFTIAGLKEIRGDKGKVLAYVTQLEPERFIIISADTNIPPLPASKPSFQNRKRIRVGAPLPPGIEASLACYRSALEGLGCTRCSDALFGAPQLEDSVNEINRIFSTV